MIKEIYACGVKEEAITARNSPGTREKLKRGKVAIAGLGGLGSNIAMMLARAGVGKLLLADFDKVEPSNLNRQHYDLTHLGMLKADALKSQLDKINPFTETETCTLKVTADNAAEIFGGYPIVCEAFDDPEHKAALVNALLEDGGKNGQKVIAASGMSGVGDANKIITKRIFKNKNLYVCGDPESREDAGFMSPRVMICAGHQANMALRLLLGLE